MPAPKFVKRGKTVPCVRASVLLHPQLHALAKKKAERSRQSLSDYVASLVAIDNNWPILKEA